jgi:hypothetical protein
MIPRIESVFNSDDLAGGIQNLVSGSLGKIWEEVEDKENACLEA